MKHEPLILVVDDDPGLLMGVSATIKKHGYQVIEAEDGNEGLEKAKKTVPDLIVSDVMMPPPNGFELRRLMGLDPQLASIPFIFLTAKSDSFDKINAIRDGADDYITKPFVVYELLARIDAVLRRVKIARESGMKEAKSIARTDLERVQREILQNFNHEMHTPLSNIMMPLQLALNSKSISPAEQSRFLRMALSNASRLEALSTDLMLLNNLDQGILNNIRQPVDLNTSVRAAINRRLERYADKGLQVTMDIDEKGKVAAPRREFTHALVHLMDNAFKFTAKNGKVHLRAVVRGNGGASLDIFDNGPGIPPHLHQKVFERFYQISRGDTRAFEGMGIGLFLARAIFRNLNGDVKVVESPMGCHVQAFLPELQSGELTYG